ncbi:MAG TPA: S-methyl-5-thioribose-1-phosphate isomerase [Pirellulaceae bacterium]
MTTIASSVEAIRWIGGIDGHLVLLDQTRLPLEICHVACQTADDVWRAIRGLQVRGAPAIGIAAAYGVCLGLRNTLDEPGDALVRCDRVCDQLATSRPTAVNLFWALDRMRRAARRIEGGSHEAVLHGLLSEAQALQDEDRQVCHAIGRAGSELVPDGARVLTHCNTGGLATSEYGTALSILFTAQDDGKRLHVYVDETRPMLQGARLTAWELQRRGIPATLICDSMAAHLMAVGRVDLVLTGADRIAANGDTANKIGTYGLAVLARAHEIPFYVAAPWSSFDPTLPDGSAIPIEERDPREVTEVLGHRIAPHGVTVYNPAFDVTPAGLIHGIVTESGLIRPVTAESIRAFPRTA